MKSTLLIFSTILGLVLVFNNTANGKSKGNPKLSMVFALDSLGRVKDSAEVDIYGNYAFLNLEPGNYTFRFQKTDCNDIVMNAEHISKDVNYHATLDFVLNYPEPVDHIDGDVPTDVDSDHYGEGIPVEKEMAASPGGRADGYSATIKATRSAAGISPRRMSMAMKSPDFGDDDMARGSEEVLSRVAGSSGGSGSGMTKPSEKAGQLTAGFWRDLDNWGKWEETNKDINIAAYKKEWNFNPQNRFSVRFLDAAGRAVIGEKVSLTDQHGQVEWEAMTDNTGLAELWAQLNSLDVAMTGNEYKVKLVSGERVFDFKIKPSKGTSETFNLPINLTATPTVDIAFVVDATGSMGDEISFLQAEMLDVITRIKKSNQCLDIKTSSVFYRDQGDEYVTIKSDFNNNPLTTVDFIYDQAAGGGGDFPEAVDAALETTVEQLNWSPKAISKMMFLLLDAPPHSDSASVKRMNEYTRKAAAKGIKIIPIVASGINQTTEFLMKYLAIATNGTYVYITDHSGIGNSHEKPTGVKENVQYLNDLMVDIINKNISWEGCKDTVINNKPNPGTVEIVTKGQWQAQFFPNPAIDFITVSSNLVPDAIQLYSISGNLVKTVEQTGEKVKIPVGDLSTGVYIVKLIKDEEQITCRMLVMH